mgnify:CR=1 FL=1|jgi:hypothetical protein
MEMPKERTLLSKNLSKIKIPKDNVTTVISKKNREFL